MAGDPRIAAITPERHRPAGGRRQGGQTVAALPHRLLGYRGADGFPVIIPVEVADHGASGLRLVALRGELPPGGRRAGFLAHHYQPQVTGLRTRSFTGWLDVADDGTAIYAPHTEGGFAAPRQKTLFLIANGLMAKYFSKKARRGSGGAVATATE